MIGLSFALPEESKGIVALLERAQREGEPALPVITGWLSGREVAIVHTGMGRASAAQRLTVFFERRQPSVLIACGFGGGLDASLRVGELFVGENYSDEALLALLDVAGRRPRGGTLVTVDEVVETREAKEELARSTGAGCVDMETEEIARQCRLRGIPIAAVRAISDTALADLPVPAKVWFDAARQRPRPAALVWHLLTHPGKIAPFVRFVRGINLARRQLTQFLVECLPALERT